jgi:hypothetical protein
LQGDVDFSRAVVNESIDITDAEIEHASLRLSWTQLVDLSPILLDLRQTSRLVWRGVFEGGLSQSTGSDEARRSFYDFLAALENNFRHQDQLADAAQVHYFAENLKTQESKPSSRIIKEVFLRGVYGYGVNPGQQVWVALIIVLLFAFVYARRGALTYGPAAERKLRLQITDIPIDWNDEKRLDDPTDFTRGSFKDFVQRYRRGLAFSISVFSKIGYDCVYAAKELRFIVIVEWVLGVVIWILFLINLSNVSPLLNRLVSKLF